MLISKEADRAERTVFLVNPRSHGLKLKFGKKSLGAPIGLGVVGSMVEQVKEQSGFQDKEINTKVVDENLGQSVNPEPGDLILVSSFSLNVKRVQALAQEVSAQGAFVVVGGIHATVAPDDFTKVGAISFRGEAGNSIKFRKLVERWLYTEELERGIRVESEGVVDPKVINLAGLPVSEKVYKQLDEKSHMHMLVATVGCTKNCATCTVMGGRVVRTRPKEEVVEEMERRVGNKMGYSLTDSDLGAGGDDYLYPLLESFAGLKIPRGMSAETTLETLDRGGNRLFDALAKAQFHRLYVGIESDNKDNLKSIRKGHNLKYDTNRVREIVRSAHKRGIKITGLFIVGFLTETVETTRSIENYIKETGLDDANISILTPLPGTEIWRQFAEDKLFDPQALDTDKLDFRHLLFKHPLGNERLLQEYEELCNRVFAVPAVLKRSARAFLMSNQHNLPKSPERQFRNSFVASFLQAYAHRRNVSW